MANEKCGACGSLKTSILGKDKRIGKTCGNEDCKLHLTVINWPPPRPTEEGKGEPSEAEGRSAPGEPVEAHPDVNGLRALCTAFRDWEEKETEAPGSQDAVTGYWWMRDIWLQVCEPAAPKAERSEAPEAKPEGSNPESSPCPHTNLKYNDYGEDPMCRDCGQDPSKPHPTPSEDLEAVEAFVRRVAIRAGEFWDRAPEDDTAMAIRWAMEKELDALRAPRPSPPVKGAPAKKEGEA
jgi:hypothetical protein